MQNKKLNEKSLEKAKNISKKNKGITLIALVVTIVILLILAGIALNLTLGNNGIVQRTIFAKEQNCIQADKEAIKMAYSTVYHLDGKVVTAQNLQEQLINDGKDVECETAENNKIKVKIVKCEHEFLVDPSTGDIENTTSDGKPVENKISIEVDPSSSTTESYKQQVVITIKSSRETITDNSVKILWTTDTSDDEPVGLSNGTNLSVENKDEKTMNSETVYTVTTSGDYYLWIKASINGKSTSQKFGPYKLLAAPSAKDIIFTPSTVAPTTSLDVKIAPSANFPGYVLQYQVASTVNSKNWKNYTSEVNITENTTIWARLYNATENKEVVSSFVVTNICLHTSGWKVQGDKHYCELCGYSEKHNYNEDVDSSRHLCSTCREYANHTFQEWDSNSHKCSECGGTYEHIEFKYYDESSHKCSDCGYIESHTYDNSISSGRCTKCNTTCSHIFEYTANSYATCRICGYKCNHGNSELDGFEGNGQAYFIQNTDTGVSTCSYCNFRCGNENYPHAWETGDTTTGEDAMYHKCSTCGIRLDHTFGSMGICSVCLYQCKHDENYGSMYWENGVCRYCGMQCTHNADSSLWSNGMCRKCGTICDHMSDGAVWMNGRCSRCGYECQHQYDSSTGRCSICNYECSHMWMDGRCSICNYECSHIWSNGGCMTCGMICQHQYDSTTGTCSICGMTCMHTFDSTGRCSICGYTDPSYSGM